MDSSKEATSAAHLPVRVIGSSWDKNSDARFIGQVASDIASHISEYLGAKMFVQGYTPPCGSRESSFGLLVVEFHKAGQENVALGFAFGTQQGKNQVRFDQMVPLMPLAPLSAANT